MIPRTFANKAWTLLRDGVIKSFPRYLRRWCPRKSKPSSMCVMVVFSITGCEFSAAQELLVVATGEGNSSIRAWGGQKNAEDSGAQSDTKRRGAQGFVAWVPLLPGSGMEQLYPLTSSSELDLQNSQPVK